MLAVAQMPPRETQCHQEDGRDNRPCPECSSTDRVLVYREGDDTCRNCGLVLGQIVDDRATYGNHQDMYNDSGCTVIGQGGDRSLTSRLKKVQSWVSHSDAPPAVLWHAAMRARMSGTLCAITQISDTKWFDNAWSMYVVVVSAGRMQEAHRNAMLAVCAYYAMFMTMTSKYSVVSLQVVFDVEDSVYKDAKKFARDILLKTAEYGFAVTHDTDNPVEELERCIRGVKQIDPSLWRLVQRLACDLDARRLHLNVLGASKLTLLRPALIHLTCAALLIHVTLQDVATGCSDVAPESMKTIHKNTVTISRDVMRIWDTSQAGLPDYQAWNVHVKNVQERVALLELSIPRAEMPQKVRRIR